MLKRAEGGAPHVTGSAEFRSEGHSRPIISVHNVTVAAKNGARILNGLSFEIRVGEHAAILGPNGSGKSSLLKLITHHYRPYAHRDQSSSVSVFGRDRWNVFELRTLLGVVSADQHQTFVEGHRMISGMEAVVSGFFASERLFDHHALTPAMEERAHAALAMMEVSHLAERPMEQMSTGEARRVLIARALAPDPRALLLDEPTTGLDLVARHRFLETLRKVARQGKTLIFITHHVEEVLPEIRRVILLRHGRSFRDGPKQDTLTSGALSACYEADVQVTEEPNGYYTATACLD